MRGIEKRVKRLEIAQRSLDIKAMTTAELDAFIKSCKTLSPEFVAAVICRGVPSFPIVKDDPDYEKAENAVR